MFSNTPGRSHTERTTPQAVSFGRKETSTSGGVYILTSAGLTPEFAGWNPVERKYTSFGSSTWRHFCFYAALRYCIYLLSLVQRWQQATKEIKLFCRHKVRAWLLGLKIEYGQRKRNPRWLSCSIVGLFSSLFFLMVIITALPLITPTLERPLKTKFLPLFVVLDSASQLYIKKRASHTMHSTSSFFFFFFFG